MRTEKVDVLVVGGGPAGLAAARELRRLGPWRVVVADREREAGGVPRHSQHTGYGLRDLHRVCSGPAYARRCVALARAAGAEVLTSTSVTGWEDRTTLATTSPAGRVRWQARAVLLATGCRERPRSARLVPGARPAGVFTTGALQQFVYLHRQPVGHRAVIVGAEHVSFSALHTLASHGTQVAAVVTDAPAHQSFELLRLVTAGLHRVPLLTGSEVTAIEGRGRVEAVEVTERAGGRTRTIACDTVVFTGDWIPDHELARSAGLAMDPATRGPVVDAGSRTSVPGVFAAGNLLHPAETADVAALGGRHAAGAIHAYLSDGAWPVDAASTLACDPPLTWVVPQLAQPGQRPPRDRFVARTGERRGRGELVVTQEGRELGRYDVRRLVPNRSISLPADWLDRLDTAATTTAPVRLTYQPHR